MPSRAEPSPAEPSRAALAGWRRSSHRRGRACYLLWTGRAKGTVSGKFTRQLAQLMEVLQAVRIAKLAATNNNRSVQRCNMTTD